MNDRPAVTAKETTLHIHLGLTVWDRYAIEIGNNGEAADALITLWLAPDTKNDTEWFYATTNGGTNLVGTLHGETFFRADDTVGVDLPESAWLREAIEDEFDLEADWNC